METADDHLLHDRRYQPTSSSVRMVGVFTEIAVRGDVLRDNVSQHVVSVDRIYTPSLDQFLIAIDCTKVKKFIPNT